MPNSDDSTEPVWRLVRVECDPAEVELISDFLWVCGAAAVEEVADHDGYAVVRTHMADFAVIDRILERFPSCAVSVDEVPVSVSETWRKHAVATHINDDIWIVPAWCPAPERTRSILIEPGATFGLGDHPTTVLAIRSALAACERGDRVHDHGTGSGVIAVVLAKCSGANVSVDDIAPESPATVEANARRNSIDPPRFFAGLPVEGASLDGLVANILAPVLRHDAPTIEEIVRPGGWIVLSGLRSEQVDSVVACYPGCDVEHLQHLDGWAGVRLRRRL